MTGSVIELSGLGKSYRTRFRGREVRALDDVSLAVERGTLFGLLGANGAGKTTTMKILLGLARPSRGGATLSGIPVGAPESRRRVGYLPEGHRFPGYLTARETLSIFGRMSGMSRRDARSKGDALLERLQIAQWADVRVRRYSKGMTQRLGLACALVHEPEVLLLDEPTDGVDPVGRRDIRDLLRELAAGGTTVFLNSHLLSEIELTCDRVAILRAGRLAACGTIAELTRREAQYRIGLAGSHDADALLEQWRASGAAVEARNGHFVVGVRDLEHVNALVDTARAGGASLSELTPLRATLEDVFVDLTRAPEGVVQGEAR